MLKDWFNSLVALAVLVILMVAGGNAMMGLGFDALSVAGAVSLPLSLAVAYKLAHRRPKPSRKR